jgi:hypothetical protein
MYNNILKKKKKKKKLLLLLLSKKNEKPKAKAKKKKKKNLSFKLLSLKIMIPTKIVNTHTRCHFYIIRETKYFNTGRY